MRFYRFFWDTHKWTGIILAIVFLNIAVSGFLLLIKKDYDWIQPPTMSGVEGSVDEFITVRRLVDVVLAENHPDFASFDDIDRVDFRPGKRVHKVRSKHNYSEIQVCAVTGEVLHRDWRPSDLLEQIHDGSFFGDWVHDYFMLLVPVGLAFLAVSGLYLWIAPKLRTRRRKRERAAGKAAAA